MTAQAGEVLFIKKRRYTMFTEPLSSYFALTRKTPAFLEEHTACVRGYVGTWKIEGNKLFCVGISGYLDRRHPFVSEYTPDELESLRQGKNLVLRREEFAYALDGSIPKEDLIIADLHTIFPDAKGPVFAEWYTGELRCPLGKQIDYRHIGYGSVHEKDLLIEICNGVVKGMRMGKRHIPAAEK